MDKGASSSPGSIPDWLQAARGFGWLARLPDPLVRDVVSGARRIEFPKGGVGLRWDDEPKTAIVLRGTARAFLAVPDGNQVTTRYLRPGDMTGVFAPRSPRIARGIQALEPSELLLIAADRMKQLAVMHPPLAWALVEELTTILNLNQRALYIRAFGSVRQRVAIAILDRAGLDGPISAGRCLLGTQSELAIAAGTVREVVATAMQGLKREGIVDVRRGGVVILDPDRLKREANPGIDLQISN